MVETFEVCVELKKYENHTCPQVGYQENPSLCMCLPFLWHAVRWKQRGKQGHVWIIIGIYCVNKIKEFLH
jgi:hypothetical protein